ncbi:MAG TPA: hypothetical protein VGO94_02370 [Mycobacteriales bacterium]|jgi:hypothetical protein|nr:hypothetical protein [Mycobacteriales bacterium]
MNDDTRGRAAMAWNRRDVRALARETTRQRRRVVADAEHVLRVASTRVDRPTPQETPTDADP